MHLPFLLSSLFHIIILLCMFFGLDISYKDPIVEENTMIVEFAQLGPKTAAPVKSDIPEIEQKKKITPQKENKDPVEQKEKTETSDHKKNSKPSSTTDDKPSKKLQEGHLGKQKKEKKKPEKNKKKDVDKKKKKTSLKHHAQMNIDAKNAKNQKGKKANLDDLLDDLMDDQGKNDKTSTASASETDESFTMSEISVLRAHISRCWNVHSGAKGAQNHIVDVEIHLSKDGMVQSAQVLDKARMKRDPYYRVAAETAQRSLLDDDCNPLPIPASAYEKWKVITFRFDPKDMF